MALKAGRYGVTKEQLRKIDEGGGGGTTVVANPEGTATADLTKLKVGDTIYGVDGDTSTCYQTTDDTESAIVDADYIPFLDSSAASGEGAPKKSTWSNFCSKIAAKLEDVFNAYLGVTSIGTGLTVDANGVLLATGSGSGGWPAISEMTPVLPVSVDGTNNRVKNIVGGYKQIGKIVYFDIVCKVATATDSATSNYSAVYNLPRPVHELEVEGYHKSGNTRTELRFIVSEITPALSPNPVGSIIVGGETLAVDDTLIVRGTYEALTAI